MSGRRWSWPGRTDIRLRGRESTIPTIYVDRGLPRTAKRFPTRALWDDKGTMGEESCRTTTKERERAQRLPGRELSHHRQPARDRAFQLYRSTLHCGEVKTGRRPSYRHFNDS